MAVELESTADDRPYLVTFGIETDLNVVPAETHCDRVFQAWDDNFLPLMPNFITLTRVVGRFGQDAADDLIVQSTLPGQAGAVSGDFLPQNNACLIRKRTALGGRKNRGRMYVPYVLPEGNVDNSGIIAGTRVTAIQTAADDFQDDLLAGDPGPSIPMVVLHSVSTDTPTPITTLEVDNLLATQRRRLRR